MPENKSKKLKEVVVTIEGGVIQYVKVPKGVIVKVMDFDVEELTVEEYNDLPINDDGDKYNCTVWESE